MANMADNRGVGTGGPDTGWNPRTRSGPGDWRISESSPRQANGRTAAAARARGTGGRSTIGTERITADDPMLIAPVAADPNIRTMNKWRRKKIARMLQEQSYNG